ncbi:tetratricopeptide repeat protein [Streptomyces sp. NBC_01762]|uniref:tetratricopeptide repeat protein n=1 Tax=unclassified Streptomyces TaxID=2593676 RepID=UPI002DDA5241|nr:MULTISPECIES: tetratricopeptide repeat protein [unclassified Streptomyces]WSC49548.1 tetratricopeptide repeat protein [Streptomyces sp. NBC_01762]WSD29120.1 tetratricopeptide repeat protein [Streptomyces sp. NBC_01751]
MEFDRRLQIRSSNSGSRSRFGSGYLIAPNLALTAAHVLGATQQGEGAVTVCRPDGGSKEFTASVRWRRRDAAVDAALVEVNGGQGWEPPESITDIRVRPPQRWGRLIGTRPHAVAVAGYPRMQKDADEGRRLDEHLMGHIRPGTSALAGRYEVLSTDPTIPVVIPPGTSGSAWSGMSGAALLCGDLLCGVVRQDRRASGGTRLSATPSKALLADPGFRAVVAEHSGWDPILEPAEPTQLLASAARERDLRSPAMLLRAEAEAVVFHGREEELRQLQQWCEDHPERFAVRVVTGPGGQGKTRLARELVQLMHGQGWVAGFLRTDLPNTNSAPDFSGLETAEPLLLVLDYAETQPRLLRALVERLRATRHRVRLLLLARSDGGWRIDCIGASAPTQDILAASTPVPLRALIPQDQAVEDRTKTFRSAAVDLARLLPNVSPAAGLPQANWAAVAAELQPLRDLADPCYGSVLTLQMAALIALLQQGGATAGETSTSEPLEAVLLRHEQRYWERTARSPVFELGRLSTETLKEAVAVAALLGATTHSEALTTAAKIPSLPAHRAADAARWLHSLYPPGKRRYWGSLRPDRVAEYHVSAALGAGMDIIELLTAASADQQAQAITVLARAVIGHHNAGRDEERNAVLHSASEAVRGAAIGSTALQLISDALPYPCPPIAPLAAGVGNSIVEGIRRAGGKAGPEDESIVSCALVNLANALADTGQQKKALSTAMEAVKGYRRLVKREGATREAGLAQALANLGTRLAEAGQHEEALSVSESAVEVYQRLVARDAAAHEVGLARALCNLGRLLTWTGLTEKALVPLEEALTLWRRLASEDPAAHEPGVALALFCVSSCLMLGGGHPSQSLDYAERSVKSYGRLAADDPSVHEAGFARALDNLSTVLFMTDRHEEALGAAEQAVEIYSRLSKETGRAIDAELASALLNLSGRLSRVERHEEAICAGGDAVDIFRRLANENPAAHRQGLARALSNFGAHLSEAGQDERAVHVAAEAVSLCRTGLRSPAFRIHWFRRWNENSMHRKSDYAMSLSNLGFLLSATGRQSEAIRTVRKSVSVFRELTERNQRVHEPNLANALVLLARVGNNGLPFTYGPLLAVAESALLYCKLTAQSPDVFRSRLIEAVQLQVALCRRVGLLDEAMEAISRAQAVAGPDVGAAILGLSPKRGDSEPDDDADLTHGRPG